MRVPKELKGNRYTMLTKVLRFFVCSAKCGRDCGATECDYINRMNNALNDIKIKADHEIRKEVAVLINGFHEDN